MNAWLFLALLLGGWAIIGLVVVAFVMWPMFMLGFFATIGLLFIASKILAP